MGQETPQVGPLYIYILYIYLITNYHYNPKKLKFYLFYLCLLLSSQPPHVSCILQHPFWTGQ